MARYAHIVGWGMSVPKKVMTNDDWAQLVDTSDEWIRTRTGVTERRVVGEGESTMTLALDAARQALDVAQLSPAQLDLIVVASVTPEHAFPATACLVQDRLGATNAAAFDLSAGCSGFIYGLSVAADFIRAGSGRHVLIVGSETLTRIIDWSDRATCVLFGDGAGAVVVSGSEMPGGILSAVLGSDGSGGDLLILPAGGSKLPVSHETLDNHLHYLQMNGREVFKFATRIMDKAARLACQKANVGLEEIELLVPHQANDRIIQAAARSLKMPEDRVFVNVNRYGNTSTASIPMALCEAIQSGRVRRNDHLVLVGFGAGLTWGAMVIQWGVPLPVAPTSWWRRVFRWLYYRWAELRSHSTRLRRKLEDLQPADQNGNGHKPRAAAPGKPSQPGPSDPQPAPPPAPAEEPEVQMTNDK
jgi:3-oxoacyl-[acyl-carrier-protein] synthase-3